MAEGFGPALRWDSHRRSQLLLWATATPAQRLAWLEEMIALAHRSGALPRSGEDPGDGPELRTNGRSP